MVDASVVQFLSALPPDRRAEIAQVRAAINARLPPGYDEVIQHGMISWVVPASRLSHTYNGLPLPLASLGAQKNYMALYLSCVYGDAAHARWFEDAFRASGKKLDMGKSCVRFKAADDLPLEVIGEAVARVPVDAYVASYEANRSRSVKPKPVAAKSATTQAKPAPTQAKPAATKSAKPAATKSAKPAATKSAKPAATMSAKPAATKPAKPAATMSAKPAATKLAKPAATKRGGGRR